MTTTARTVIARGLAACGFLLLLTALIAAATTASAQTPSSSIKSQLVGTWQLVSINLDNTQPYGAKPQGFMSYDANGHFSVIVLSAGQAKNISYFGTYSVNDADSSVTIHIDGSTLAREDGHDLKRKLVFSGDQLVVQSPNGKVSLTWKKSS